ncbi:MAG TPA: serine kinase [Burkholderiaceae bacterium]|nr:serine kinase [Burkholderiaceae bacterium]
MTIEWDRLIDVRERRKRSALEKMLAERREAERSRAQLQREQAEREQRAAAKVAHWQATRAALGEGGGHVAQLVAATAWSGALDAAIAQQDRVVQQAQAASAERERALDASRAALRTAVGHVEKATRMQQRELKQQQRSRDACVDAQAEEVAAVRWSMQRAV